MQKVIIHSAELKQTNGTNNRGKQYTRFNQTGWIFLGDNPFPTEFDMAMWPNRETGEAPKPFPVGEYLAVPKVTGVEQYGRPKYEMDLKPVKPA